jgi:hypothetical protein
MRNASSWVSKSSEANFPRTFYRWFFVRSFLATAFHHGYFVHSVGIEVICMEGKSSLLSIMNPPDKSLELFDYDSSEIHSAISLLG